MKMKKLLEKAKMDLEKEKKELAVIEIKNRLDEIRAMKITIIQMEKSLDKLLEEDINEIIFWWR